MSCYGLLENIIMKISIIRRIDQLKDEACHNVFQEDSGN